MTEEELKEMALQNVGLVEQSVEFLDTKEDWERGFKRIMRCTRVAYRSNNIGKTEEERRKRDEALVKSMIVRENGSEDKPRHTSTMEHAVFGVIIKCSRAIANELVRHRHTAYTQESTRYVNFGKKKAEFILSPSVRHADSHSDSCESECYVSSYMNYLRLVNNDGLLPQFARDVLPLGLATTLAMTTNITEWRRIFELRCDNGAHPDARSIAWTILTVFNKNAPWAFNDIYEKFKNENIPLSKIIMD